jgi:tetratricopeptide (TPR) repeat protein
VLKKLKRTMTWMASREATLNRLATQAGKAKTSGNLAEAEKLYREIVELTGTTFGQFDSDYARSLADLADVLEAQQRYSEALRLRERIAVILPLLEHQPSAI